MRRMPSANVRNRLELITIKSFARPGNETPKLASGARASMPGQHKGLMREILALDILLARMQVEAIPPPRLGGIPTLIVNLAIWTWIVIKTIPGWDVHKNTAPVKPVETDPGVLVAADLMSIVHMGRQPGHTTAV
jgi:hypothetical protein